MRYFRRARFFLVSVGIFLAFPSSSSPQQEDPPLWWNIKIAVECWGEYQLESREARCTGTYALAFLWIGTIEKDDADYLLVHRSCDLTRWEIEERLSEGGSLKSLSKEEIADKPELRMKYILKEGGDLFFDFVIKGFDVPKGFPSRSFYLSLPASEENGDQPGGINYDDFIKTGSNRIVIEEKKFLMGHVEKTFDWAWSRQLWLQDPDVPVFQASSHGTRVTVSVSSAPKKTGGPEFWERRPR